MTEGQCGLEQVARALGLHPRTLQRRLAASGQDYSEILAQARFEKALRLMDDPTLRIFDIALELGFLDTSNFSRSFRLWTGVTPSIFRAAHFSTH
ncbi:MAG: helix-turn-helix transcriptional regulator [Salaquimonas sp.]|nr:helix-turn-helix transcriptional regulator [Salaquimonas sp.]